MVCPGYNRLKPKEQYFIDNTRSLISNKKIINYKVIKVVKVAKMNELDFL